MNIAECPLRLHLHATATALLPWTATTPGKWVRPPIRDSAIIMDGVGAADHFSYGKDTIHATGAVAVSCKRTFTIKMR